MTIKQIGDPLNPGKFHQSKVRQHTDALEYKKATGYTDKRRFITWIYRVLTMLQTHKSEGYIGLDVKGFETLWSKLWPNDAIEWYMPWRKQLLQSIEGIPGLRRKPDNCTAT